MPAIVPTMPQDARSTRTRTCVLECWRVKQRGQAGSNVRCDGQAALHNSRNAMPTAIATQYHAATSSIRAASALGHVQGSSAVAFSSRRTSVGRTRSGACACEVKLLYVMMGPATYSGGYSRYSR